MTGKMGVMGREETLLSEGRGYKSDCTRRRRRHKHAVLFCDDDIVHLGESWVSEHENHLNDDRGLRSWLASWQYGLKAFVSMDSLSCMLPFNVVQHDAASRQREITHIIS